MNKRQQWMGALGLLLAVAVLFGLWTYRPGSDAITQTATPLTVAVDCNSAQATCEARGDGLAIELGLGPEVRPMQPFDIRLRALEGQLSASAIVELEFQMQAMNMGLNRYRLRREEHGAWTGQAILPVCRSGRSDWLAQLDIRDGERRWMAVLPFTTE